MCIVCIVCMLIIGIRELPHVTMCMPWQVHRGKFSRVSLPLPLRILGSNGVGSNVIIGDIGDMQSKCPVC